MDSRWFYQALGESSNKKSNLKAAESDLDLSLSLGLSNKQEDENEVQLRPQLQNFTFNGSLITKEANEHAMADGTGQVGMNYNGIVAGGSSAVDSYGSSNIGAVGAAMNVHGTFPGWDQATSGYGFNSGEGNSGMNMMSYNEQALNVNQELFGTVGHNLSGYNPGGTPTLALPTMNYATIDYLPGGEDGSSFGSRKKIARQERQAMFFDPNKRCSNPTCCTNNTPMWRKGPLGPKTLCNACGIKYRKEEERRRSAGAGAPDGQIAKADSNE